MLSEEAVIYNDSTNFQLPPGQYTREQGWFHKNGSQLSKVYMVSLELDINISPEAGGIKFFQGDYIQSLGGNFFFLQNPVFPDLSTAKQWVRGDSH